MHPRSLFPLGLALSLVVAAGMGHTTSLSDAARRGDTRRVARLLASGRPVDSRDAAGMTPLLVAARGEQPAVVAQLLAAGADVAATDEAGMTPLNWAVRENCRAAAALLLEHGAKSNAVLAAGPGDLAALQGYLAAGQAVDSRDPHGWTPLIMASRNGHTEVARWLLAHGAAVDAQEDAGETALAKAARQAHPAVGRLLLAHGAAYTIHAAAAFGDLGRVKQLIARGTPVDEQDGRTWTALMMACRNNRPEVAAYLLSRGAEANIHCYHGDSPLHQAAGQGAVPTVRLLLDHWAQANTRDGAGLTPLHRAAAGGHTEVVKCLLAHGGNVLARGPAGLSAAHAASMNGHRETAQVLRRAAAAAGAPPPAADYKAQLIGQYSFYKTAVGRFAPVYPALARQIVMDYGVKDGICVDLGGGCGSLSTALVKITNLKSYVLDIDPAAVRLCGLLAAENGLSDRVIPIEGDAMDLPFVDNFADIVVSRGSIFFWPSQVQGVKEAYRILKPGGVAYIGGGFSRLIDKQTLDGLKADIVANRSKGSGGWVPLEQDMVEQCHKVGIQQVRLLHEPDNLPERGWWVEVRK